MENSSEKQALNESQAKILLAQYDIPVVSETVARTPDEAVAAAERFGYPVVLKGMGQTLHHKTELGLVRLNLQDQTQVIRAADDIAEKAGDALEGWLVQPQIEGRRELVAGLFLDPQFGPVVMFGLGGVLVEALSDITFRVAPFDDTEALQMLEEIEAKALLGNFRGERAANRQQLVQILVGLSAIAAENPEITEIDINPIIVKPDGDLCAVDALVVKGPAHRQTDRPAATVAPDALGRFFHPRSIAFIGASSQLGKWGHMLFTMTLSGGYQGDVFLVNPKGGMIAGRHVYPSVAEIPDPVDLAVVTIPASRVIPIIGQLAAKKIQNMLLISSGFSETDREGKALEKQLVKQARQAGILVVGPNTMGICNPHIHLYCTGAQVRPIPGSTAVVSQSGNMGTQLLAFAEQQEIGIRGFCGSGNEGMITIEDFIDAFEDDDLSKTVMLYVESVKNGPRFLEGARRVGLKKPIVLLKGGRSKAGTRAAASHTGALAHDARVFDAVCRQAGIVQVDQSMDLLDLAAAFSSIPLPKGNQVAIMTLGGGWGVVTADLCAAHGLKVPDLTPEIKARLDQRLPAYWSRSNPVDLVGERELTLPMKIIEELVRWDGCDAVIHLGILGRKILVNRLTEAVRDADPDYSSQFLDDVNRTISGFEEDYLVHIMKLMEQYQKPIYGVSLVTDQKNQTVFRFKNRIYRGISFPTPERAVKSCSKMLEYHRFIARQAVPPKQILIPALLNPQFSKKMA